MSPHFEVRIRTSQNLVQRFRSARLDSNQQPGLRRPMRYPTELRARRSTVIASLNRYGAAALSSLLNPAAFI